MADKVNLTLEQVMSELDSLDETNSANNERIDFLVTVISEGLCSDDLDNEGDDYE